MKLNFDIYSVIGHRDLLILILLESAETGLPNDTTFVGLKYGFMKLYLC
jgi:hypothetical protein